VVGHHRVFSYASVEGVGVTKKGAQKRKAGAGSRTPNVVYYRVKYSKRYRKVKRNLVAVTAGVN
jgi:hypothetical protein